MKNKSRLASSFHIAGFTYYDGAMALKDLKPGKTISLERETGNIYDEYAVTLYCGNLKLGYIPKHHNKIIALLLENGYDAFEAIIQQVDKREHPEEQVRVGVFVKNIK